MPKVYFISDVHLGMEEKEVEQAKQDRLLRFLASITPDAGELYIIGDLFDAWFEYRTVVPKGFHRILTALEDLCRRGIRIHYLVGNHDCWMRSMFRDEFGMTVYPVEFGAEIQGRKIFLHHGDGLANNDTGYKILKRILRNRLSIWLYSWLHPDIGVALARSSSRTSRRHTAEKHYGEEDGMVRFAARKIADGFDIVIMGHRHVPALRQVGKGLYVNLGDWISHNSYAVMDGGRLELKQWSS